MVVVCRVVLVVCRVVRDLVPELTLVIGVLTPMGLAGLLVPHVLGLGLVLRKTVGERVDNTLVVLGVSVTVGHPRSFVLGLRRVPTTSPWSRPVDRAASSAPCRISTAAA